MLRLSCAGDLELRQTRRATYRLAVAKPDADPMPRPPARPDAGACCGSGCALCVFDLYELELDRYREALSAWRARHPEAPATDG